MLIYKRSVPATNNKIIAEFYPWGKYSLEDLVGQNNFHGIQVHFRFQGGFKTGSLFFNGLL